MTCYRACIGCFAQGDSCATRDDMRSKIKGLGITTVGWKCRDRRPKFNVGQAVWATTVASYSGDADDGIRRDDFPAFIVRVIGPKAVVYIELGAVGVDGNDFDGNGSGFCKIPMSRLRSREAPSETVCTFCGWLGSKGHDSGCISPANKKGLM